LQPTRQALPGNRRDGSARRLRRTRAP